MCGSLQVVQAQPVGTVTITSTAPGAGVATIDVNWTYSNCTGANTVYINATDVSTKKSIGAGVFPAKSPGSGTVQTSVSGASVSLLIEVRDSKGKVLASGSGKGTTK